MRGLIAAVALVFILCACAGTAKIGKEAAPELSATPSDKAEGEPRSAAAPAPSSFAGEKASPAAASSPGRAAAPSQSGLKAGFSDDNSQFNYFIKFLEQYGSVPHSELAVGERIAVQVVDSNGRAVANAAISVSVDGRIAARGTSYSDGLYYLYPLELRAPQATTYGLEASLGGALARTAIARGGPRKVVLALGRARTVPSPLPVDVLFVLDTTGSMGEEIERLRSTIDIISANIGAMKPKPALRFGMVLYRDREDSYDTKVVPLTSDLGEFQTALDAVSAEGGGDEPEDLQSALRDALGAVKWNENGIRLGFIVTDASAHLDYGQSYAYASSAREAKARGIKFFCIGAGGLPLEGEYVLRQIAQYTQGRYIFLTYGESGEAAGGVESSVSHHTGANFATDKLEAIVIRFVREEIAWQSDRPLEVEQAYSEARARGGEAGEDTLGKLFAQALQDLFDYSSISLAPGSKLAILPLGLGLEPGQGETGDGASKTQAEYFGSQLGLAASKSRLFTVVERRDLQSVLAELELQLSALADEEGAARAGRLLGADFLVTGTLFRAPERYELFLKLLRVETAEVLSAAKARIDLGLGL